MKILVACECSGTVRDAFRAQGHEAWSCDIKPADPGVAPEFHIQGDALALLHPHHKWDLLIAHPPCTYLNIAAAWAFEDPNFDRFPGVGYHQKVKPHTLVGEARRKAQREALDFVRAFLDADIPRIAIENPVGAISRNIRKADQYIQPYEHGEDASKKTGLWLKGLKPLVPTKYVEPRIVDGKPRWGNQTDSGQNKLGPSENRAAMRSKTYTGIATAMAEQWGTNITEDDCF